MGASILKLEWNPPKITDRVAHLTSEAEHSASVVFGKERTDGTRMPARDFFTAAVGESDLVGEFARSYNGNIDAAFQAVVVSLHEKIKDVIRDPRWDWDRETRRRNGSLVGSPRDIVDMGELLKSQTWEIAQ